MSPAAAWTLPAPVDRGAAPVRIYRTRIVGLRGRNADGNSRQDIARGCRAGQRLQLRLEPRHRHDAVAVSVWTADGRQLGYLPAHVAASHVQHIEYHRAEAGVAEVIGGGRGQTRLAVVIEVKLFRHHTYRPPRRSFGAENRP